MFDFIKESDRKEVVHGEEKSRFEVALQEMENLSIKAKDYRSVERISERGRFLKLGSHKVTGSELNAVVTHIDDAIIQTKNVQVEALRHIACLYRAMDSLDAEHIEGILTAIKAAESATDWARINDENIGKITSYLMQDDRVMSYKKEQDSRIAALEIRLKTVCFVAGFSAMIALASLVFCIMVLI